MTLITPERTYYENSELQFCDMPLLDIGGHRCISISGFENNVTRKFTIVVSSYIATAYYKPHGRVPQVKVVQFPDIEVLLEYDKTANPLTRQPPFEMIKSAAFGLADNHMSRHEAEHHMRSRLSDYFNTVMIIQTRND